MFVTARVAIDFQRIGASGFLLGSIRTVEAQHAPGLRLRFATLTDGIREAIDKRIRAILPGDNGAIASALIKRDTISAPVNEAMYVSGLAHGPSISGYHMAVVAGIMFFALRALFALMPAIPSRSGRRSSHWVLRPFISCCRERRSRPSAPSS